MQLAARFSISVVELSSEQSATQLEFHYMDIDQPDGRSSLRRTGEAQSHSSEGEREGGDHVEYE